MRQSMTGFASRQGQGLGLTWTWEMRGVNGKGLDLRLRLPDWVEGLEPQVRAMATKALDRGNVQIGLKLASDGTEGAQRLDAVQLDSLLTAMHEIEEAAMDRGLSLAPSTSADIVALRGVLTSESAEVDVARIRALLLSDFEAALADFIAARRAEGAALTTILQGQFDEIARLVNEAAETAEARIPQARERLRAQLARVMENTEGVDPARLAQELALIAVKADVTEEIDRLRAHVDRARALLAEDGAVGRKLDFLCQEFNREANTLCSKSGDPALTSTGLALKTVIDQMREQVQNVE
ncbi:YicC/YloC family endoribonuclease [Ponticoccus alexandrii]|uniref:YicC family protein n=1 Tax=Ponticoccus alexandrii TaxID=1943633 RepID=A0ABX7F7M7_9RHOB|nr:YicC/YloC family endoribonuclease [Ponticoccus alexandrii]ETA51474.1 hypothetical protein P279_13800 [Rhodobacteraceae bacterium PD-2]QRF66525.1 YicC family protein [Ponticoccus alexandrii]